MLQIRDLYKIQSEYGVSEGNFKEAEVSFEEYLANLRTYISRNLPEGFTSENWDAKKKEDTYITMITYFVDQHKVNVANYVTPEGAIDTQMLLADLIDAVTGEGIIRDALEDPDVDEIQINDMKTIFVQKGGITDYYRDRKGRVMQFGNNDEIQIFLNKLLDDGKGNIPQFTDGKPILNAKTVKHQYRVNAVHSSANTQAKPPYNFPITTVVIRKFKESTLTIDDLINSGACTEKMGRLIMLLGRADMKLFCVGPTGSGKTTLLRIIASTVPEDKRMILIQNPTEISFMERDENGRNRRNVVHWEVVQNADTNSNSTATMSNLISNTLRATPEIVLVGEARESDEFRELLRVMRTGHKTFGTFHADGARDAVERFADEITESGGNTMTSIRNVCNSINLIISQFKFDNGERKIMEISEILGVDDKGEPVINTLFKFDFTGRMIKDENGRNKVEGKFVPVNPLSKRLQNAMFKASIPFSQIAEFCSDEDVAEYNKMLESATHEE